MVANTSLALPNPYTPLAFLPPTIADQFQVSIYLTVAGFAVFIWDWLTSIPAEYKFLTTSKFSVPNAIYLISRIGTLVFFTFAIIFQTTNTPHCQRLVYAGSACYVLSIPASSLLFYFRVRAIWANSMAITVLFGMLWLAVFGTSILVVFVTKGEHIGPTQRCIETSVQSYASIVAVVSATYDTFIFIAASARIVSFTYAGDTWRARFRSFFSGDGLPRLSKSLLQSGQLYYFAAFGLAILMTGMVLSPSIPPVYRAMPTVPCVAIENILACYVFRATKLGFIQDDVSSYNRSTPRSGLEFAPAPGNPVFDKSRARQVNVEISTVIEMSHPLQDEICGKPKGGSDASVWV